MIPSRVSVDAPNHFRMALRPACLAALLLLCSAVAAAQGNSATAKQEKPGTLRSQRNLVLVRVVVRDAHGDAVTGLSKNDFEVYENKKQQSISYFSAEAPEPAATTMGMPRTGEIVPGAAALTQLARNLTALFFDDYHIAFGNLVQVREAARRYLQKSLETGAKVGVFTASGKPQLEFTSDPKKIDQALAQLNFNRRFELTECPKMPPHFAELVANDVPTDQNPTQHNESSEEAISEDKPLKIAEAFAAQQHCPAGGISPDEDMRNRAVNMVMVNKLGVQETLIALANLVQGMAETPGDQRTIAMVSDGFYATSLQYRMDEVVAPYGPALSSTRLMREGYTRSIQQLSPRRWRSVPIYKTR